MRVEYRSSIEDEIWAAPHRRRSQSRSSPVERNKNHHRYYQVPEMPKPETHLRSGNLTRSRSQRLDDDNPSSSTTSYGAGTESVRSTFERGSREMLGYPARHPAGFPDGYRAGYPERYGHGDAVYARVRRTPERHELNVFPRQDVSGYPGPPPEPEVHSMGRARGPYAGDDPSHSWVPPISKLENPPSYYYYDNYSPLTGSRR